MNIARGVLCALLLAAVALSATADPIIFDNGTPDQFGASVADADYPFEVADDFVLSAGNNVITGINWWGAYAYEETPGVDDFSIYLYTDNGGVPDVTAFLEIAVGEANRTATAQGIWGGTNPIYAYSTNIAPLTLTAGQTYYLSIVNDTTADDDDNWYWPTSAIFTGGVVPGREGINDGGSWGMVSPIPAELAFQLTGPGVCVVPEPASVALLGFGLAGFAVRRFRGKR